MIRSPIVVTRRGDKPPPVTPYILIPCFDGDVGVRPAPMPQAVMNPSVTAVKEGGIRDIRLSCTVKNLGAARCTAGLAAFYTGYMFYSDHANHASLTPQQVQTAVHLVGYASFEVPQAGTVVVACPNLWSPITMEEVHQGVLVQVYDMFTDRMTAPFDAPNDRHVARNDGAMKPLFP